MTVPVWPSTLPNYVFSAGYSEALAEARLFAEMPADPQPSRSFDSAKPRQVQCQFPVTIAQKAILEDFWLDDIGEGVLPFIFPDPVNHLIELTTEADVELTDEADNVLLIDAWWLVKFADGAGPAFSPRGLEYLTSFTLEVLSDR